MSTFSLQLICVFLILSSAGISASTPFENCNESYFISEINRDYQLPSPFYPFFYPSGSSCLYTLTAPDDYEIVAVCSLSIPKVNDSCSTDLFLISRNGDPKLEGAEQICGSGNITRTSVFNKLTLGYYSTEKSRGGRFFCKINLRPQACDCGWSSETRIVGGTAAKNKEYPSIVSLRNNVARSHVCGGSIINHFYIITAAHCTDFLGDPANVLICAGYYENNGTSDFLKIYEAERFFIYPTYNSRNTHNDIALIKSKTSMEYSSHIGPVCLPFDQRLNTFAMKQVQIVGWGTLSFAGPLSKTLQTATVEVVPSYECDPTELCTNSSSGKDSCQKDSGGPVILKGVLRQYLVGIIAKGMGCNGLGINTRITTYIDWINYVTRGSLCYKPLPVSQT